MFFAEKKKHNKNNVWLSCMLVNVFFFNATTLGLEFAYWQKWHKNP